MAGMKGNGKWRFAAILMTAALAGLLVWGGISFFGVVRQGGEQEPWEPGVSATGADALGMVLVDIDGEEAAREFRVADFGVYILAMEERGEAYRAGLRSGDRIVTLAGREVSSAEEVNGLLAREAGAESLTVTVIRQGEGRTLLLTLSEAVEEAEGP